MQKHLIRFRMFIDARLTCQIFHPRRARAQLRTHVHASVETRLVDGQTRTDANVEAVFVPVVNEALCRRGSLTRSLAFLPLPHLTLPPSPPSRLPRLCYGSNHRRGNASITTRGPGGPWRTYGRGILIRPSGGRCRNERNAVRARSIEPGFIVFSVAVSLRCVSRDYSGRNIKVSPGWEEEDFTEHRGHTERSGMLSRWKPLTGHSLHCAKR